jgi:hypothetical protein
MMPSTIRGLLLPLMLCVLGGVASAQTECESRCNQQASECLKVCTGDPKDAQKVDERERLVKCLAKCEAKSKPCKSQCGR